MKNNFIETMSEFKEVESLNFFYLIYLFDLKKYFVTAIPDLYRNKDIIIKPKEKTV